MNVIDFGMSMLGAVSSPRVVAVSDSIDISNRIARRVTDALVRDGYDVKRSRRSYAFAALHGIRLDGRRCSGGADPQRADPQRADPQRADPQRDGMAVSVSVAGQADGHRPNGR